MTTPPYPVLTNVPIFLDVPLPVPSESASSAETKTCEVKDCVSSESLAAEFCN